MDIKEFCSLFLRTLNNYIRTEKRYELFPSDQINEIINPSCIDSTVLEIFEHKLSRAVEPLKIKFNISWCDTINDIYYNHIQKMIYSKNR